MFYDFSLHAWYCVDVYGSVNHTQMNELWIIQQTMINIGHFDCVPTGMWHIWYMDLYTLVWCQKLWNDLFWKCDRLSLKILIIWPLYTYTGLGNAVQFQFSIHAILNLGDWTQSWIESVNFEIPCAHYHTGNQPSNYNVWITIYS